MQDELVTIRGERFVIPVKIEQRRRVQGVAHGASSSGQTVFIEPLETIEQNNELVRLLEDEQAEIHRILLEMTGRIGEQADSLEARWRFLASWNFSSPRRVSRKTTTVWPCSFIAANEEESRTQAPDAAQDSLVLRKARHPLLERTLKPKGRPVVP